MHSFDNYCFWNGNLPLVNLVITLKSEKVQFYFANFPIPHFNYSLNVYEGRPSFIFDKTSEVFNIFAPVNETDR